MLVKQNSIFWANYFMLAPLGNAQVGWWKWLIDTFMVQSDNKNIFIAVVELSSLTFLHICTEYLKLSDKLQAKDHIDSTSNSSFLLSDPN